MNIDLAKTVSLIRGGLLDHRSTWESYFESTPSWKETAIQLTVPLLLANLILSFLFSRLVGGYAMYAPVHGGFMAFILSLVMLLIGLAVTVFIFNWLAGVFGGQKNLDRAFAAVSLAVIPAWVAGIIASLIPWFGVFIALAGGIMTLVFLYRIMPLALGIPAENRVKHYVLSLLAVFIIQVVLGLMIARDTMRQMDAGDFSKRSDSSSGFGSGMFGDLQRQGQLMDAASADVYDPPEDGELSQDQVEAYVQVLKKTRALQEEYSRDVESIAAEIEAKEKAGESMSVSDLQRLYSGAGTAIGLNNAEMEIVKTGGGNWAEHVWVKEQLRAAKIHQGEGSDALEHNYELYQEFQEELEAENP